MNLESVEKCRLKGRRKIEEILQFPLNEVVLKLAQSISSDGSKVAVTVDRSVEFVSIDYEREQALEQKRDCDKERRKEKGVESRNMKSRKRLGFGSQPSIPPGLRSRPSARG